MATGTIKGITVEPELISGTSVTSTMAATAYTILRTLTVTAGTWLIIGHVEASSSFTEAFYVAISRSSSSTSPVAETVVRGTGENGGGLITMLLETRTASTVYNLLAFNGSNSSKSATALAFKAIRIR